MYENNQMMSVEGQLVGMPLAGPESFSQQQLDYLKRALGVDETVLFTSDTSVTSFTTSEPIENFEYLKIIVEVANGVKAISNVVMTGSFTTYLSLAYFNPHTYGNGKDFYMWRINYSRSGNTYTWYNGAFVGYAGTQVSGGDAINTRGRVYKVIGIHRIAGGNT